MGIAIKIRRGQGPVWGRAKRLASAFLEIHVPVPGFSRPFFRLLYALHVGVRESVAWVLRFFWYEPLFRSQCERVGRGLQIEQLPYICGTGRIVIGDRVRLSGKSSIGFGRCAGVIPELSIGDGSFIGHACTLGVAKSVVIGRRVLIAGGVRMADYDGHPVDAARRRASEPNPPEAVRPIVIGDDVWIGTRAIILKGVTVGARSIVGAGAVVVHDVPSDVVVAGNPARIVKELEAEVQEAGAVCAGVAEEPPRPLSLETDRMPTW